MNPCPNCSNEIVDHLGTLGIKDHFRCRACHAQWSADTPEAKISHTCLNCGRTAWHVSKSCTLYDRHGGAPAPLCFPCFQESGDICGHCELDLGPKPTPALKNPQPPADDWRTAGEWDPSKDREIEEGDYES